MNHANDVSTVIIFCMVMFQSARRWHIGLFATFLLITLSLMFIWLSFAVNNDGLYFGTGRFGTDVWT